MAENHRRRIAHFGRSSVFIAILRVVVGSEAMAEGVMRPIVNDGLADERPVFIEPFRTKILESLAANVFVPTRCGTRRTSVQVQAILPRYRKWLRCGADGFWLSPP